MIGGGLLFACNPFSLNEDIDTLNHPASVSLQSIIDSGLAVGDTFITSAFHINTSGIDTLLSANNLAYEDIQNISIISFRFSSDRNLEYIEKVSIFLKSLDDDSDSILVAFSEELSSTKVDLELIESSYQNKYLTQPDTLLLQTLFITKKQLTKPDTLDIKLDLVLMGKL